MRGERALTLDDGPWTHLLDAGPGTEGSYQYGQNIYPEDPLVAASLVGRPGRWRTNLDYGIAPVPESGVRVIQAVGQFTLPFGQWTVAVVDGKFYTYVWNIDTWNGGPLPALLTSLGITMQADEPVYLLQLRDGLMISDGVNTPWLWDGSGFLAPNVTKLTNVPPLFGQPRLRGGRVYGIRADDHTVIVWSEVDQPNVGYESGGYNNAWRVTQSNPNQLTVIAADNEGLTLFRRHSTTRVYGEDPQEFSTGNAEDTGDERVGVISPRAVVPLNRGLLVLDGELHAQWIFPGAEAATPVWHGLGATVAYIRKVWRRDTGLPGETLSEQAIAAEYPAAGLVLFAIRAFSNDQADWSQDDVGNPESWVLVYDTRPETPRAVAVWRGLGNIQAMATVRVDTNTSSDSHLMFGADGEIFVLGNPDQDYWNDAGRLPTMVPLPVRHIVETRPLGYSTKTEKHFDMLTVVGSAPVGGQTPNQQTLLLEVLASDLSAPGQVAYLRPLPATGEDTKTEVGTEARGRYARVRITHPVLDEQFSISAISLNAIVTGGNPGGR